MLHKKDIDCFTHLVAGVEQRHGLYGSQVEHVQRDKALINSTGDAIVCTVDTRGKLAVTDGEFNHNLINPRSDALGNATIRASQRPQDAIENGRFATAIAADPGPQAASEFSVVMKLSGWRFRVELLPNNSDAVDDEPSLWTGH